MEEGKRLQASTRSIVASGFAPHGHIDIWREGDLLIYEATGPFNVELVSALAVAQQEVMQSMNTTRPWASIGSLKKSALMSLDALARYADIMRAPKPEGWTPVATAFVIGPEVEGGNIMAPHFSKIYADIGRPMQVFQSLHEAMLWSNACIAHA